MRLIIENWDGALYLYRESEEQYKKNKGKREKRGVKKIKKKFIDYECALVDMPYNSYAVYKVKK